MVSFLAFKRATHGKKKLFELLPMNSPNTGHERLRGDRDAYRHGAFSHFRWRPTGMGTMSPAQLCEYLVCRTPLHYFAYKDVRELGKTLARLRLVFTGS